MTLDRIVICMFGVPVAGIARLRPRQRGNSSSGIVNLWDLPASITRSRLLFLPFALVMAQRKWPWRRPSRTIWPIWSSASRS